MNQVIEFTIILTPIIIMGSTLALIFILSDIYKNIYKILKEIRDK